RLRELVGVLQGAGAAVGDDPVADGRRFLMTPPSIQIDQQRDWPMPGPRGTGRVDEAEAWSLPGAETAAPELAEPEPPPGPSEMELAEIEALERELVTARERLTALEALMRELEAARSADFAELEPDAVRNALGVTLAAYRAGAVLAGQVP